MCDEDVAKLCKANAELKVQKGNEAHSCRVVTAVLVCVGFVGVVAAFHEYPVETSIVLLVAGVTWVAYKILTRKN